MNGSCNIELLRKISIKIFVLTITCSLVLVSNSLAAPMAYVSAADKEVSLSPFLKYLPERTIRLTIDQVCSKPYSEAFSAVGSVNHGFVNTPYWVRFTIKNQSNIELKRLLEISFPFLDNITLYEPGDQEGFKAHRTGRALPFSSREIKHRNFLFPLKILPGTHTYYVRIETESAMYFPMTLWEEHAFWKADHEAQFALGIYYGIIVVMALYNLFIFFSLKDRAYLYYVLYIASFALYQMTANGLAYEYLWPNAVWWNRHSTLFFAASASTLAILFTKTFLSTKSTTPLLDRLLSLIAVFSMVIAILSLLFSYSIMLKITLGLVAIFVAMMIVTGVVCLRRGQRSARFYLLAWLALLTGILLLIFWNVGWLPTHFLTIYSIQIGSVLDVVLLSLALADRINELRTAREQALEEAMAQRIMAEKQKEAMVRELHDGIGAISTNISILAEKARLLGPSKEIDRDLKTISELAKKGRIEIGSFMECLDEGDQEAGVFVPELRYLGNKILSANGIEFLLDERDVEEHVKLNPFVRINVLKIYQEALTNILKHAGATKVHVKICINDKSLNLKIVDNGRGLPTNGNSIKGGRGILNMKKRAEGLGGNITLFGRDGTQIELQIPLDELKGKGGMDETGDHRR